MSNQSKCPVCGRFTSREKVDAYMEREMDLKRREAALKKREGGYKQMRDQRDGALYQLSQLRQEVEKWKTERGEKCAEVARLRGEVSRLMARGLWARIRNKGV